MGPFAHSIAALLFLGAVVPVGIALLTRRSPLGLTFVVATVAAAVVHVVAAVTGVAAPLLPTLVPSVVALAAGIVIARATLKQAFMTARADALAKELSRHTEEASSRIEASELRYRDLARATSVGVFEADTDGRLIYANERWTLLAGIPNTAAVGDGWLRAVAKVDRDHVRAAWREAVNDGVTFDREFRIDMGHDASVRWVACLAVPQGESTDPLGYVGTWRDVTERREGEEAHRELQRRVRQTEKLESLAEMVGGIAHDFNNLLVVILGNTGVALARVGSEHAAVDPLDAICEASERAAELVERMLVFAGRSSRPVEPVALKPLLERSFSRATEAVGAPGSIRWDLGKGVNEVVSDVVGLEQAIYNLAENALEAASEGEGEGIVGITTRKVSLPDGDRNQVGDPQPGAYLAVSFSDDGPGFSEESRRRAFEPFYSTRFTGRGLGLSVVHGFVRAQGGAVRIADEPGGAVVTLLVPLGDLREAPVPEPSRPSSFGVQASEGSPRVLVVDDEEIVRDTFVMMLSDHGFRTAVAIDGPDALAQFSELKDDLAIAIVDVNMPGMGGAEVVAALREESPGFPVIVSSGFATDDLEDRFDTDVSISILKKPFMVDELIACVRAALT